MHPRIRLLNEAPVNPDAKYVLYWAQMKRRVDSNHGLAYAIHWADKLNLPVLFYEGLTCDYPYANDRFHTFVLEGVPETRKRCKKLGVGYCFYLRKTRKSLNYAFYQVAANAALVVTDDYPTFIARQHNASVPLKVQIPYYVVDSSCVVPMMLIPDRQYAAYTIRPKIHKLLPEQMKPLTMKGPKRKWEGPLPDFDTEVVDCKIAELVAECEIDHSVAPSLSFKGGRKAVEKLLSDFLESKLRRYAKERNSPSAHATSDMSPYLHFGQISSLELALAARDYADEHQLMSGEYLEELIVRRELAFNFARTTARQDSLEVLPDWVLKTLAKHDNDPREFVYNQEQFEKAETHDPLWNAMQKEMLLRGKIHGYYRMYWGKKIIEWSGSHKEALATMIYLHDRYALDGRDPNTYTNILWCFGMHDRPWGERPIFGMIRYMGLDGMKRKTDVDGYLREIGYLERNGKDPFQGKS